MTEFSRNTPAWCRKFVERVSSAEDIEVREFWYRAARNPLGGGSGRAFVGQRRIVVTLGRLNLLRDRQATVLHELAHLACPEHEHHGRLFYSTLFDMAERAGLRGPVLRHESRYRAMAVEVARERKYPGWRAAARRWERQAERDRAVRVRYIP